MALIKKTIIYMRKPLNTIANIRAGYTFRGRVNEDPTGNIPVLQIKDLKDRVMLTGDQLPRINWPDTKRAAKEAATVQPGEILLPARGEYYRASILLGDEPVIATSQLFVLRLTSKKITPEYLNWYLNQSTAQHYFQTHRSGTSMPMLNKQSLGALPVAIPPLSTQEKIVSVQRCWEQEQQLTKQLLANREQMLNGIFQQLLEQ
ncbi:restriction endonuclease subunit S [endosymbiont of Lamellibrachia barhami]|uniref:restriction endonuclease subunit S n=1 Tax=endosymbiont of Lamellibrachia barhami TaxID=205975 RepID=UPI0015B37440|nr:restriction endonuclease subunit S [endosymbiont of Lamellibrachia barhami]